MSGAFRSSVRNGDGVSPDNAITYETDYFSVKRLANSFGLRRRHAEDRYAVGDKIGVWPIFATPAPRCHNSRPCHLSRQICNLSLLRAAPGVVVAWCAFPSCLAHAFRVRVFLPRARLD